jgi:hypothetical protein
LRSPLKAEGRDGDGKDTSASAAPDSCSALIPSGAPVGAPLLDPGDTERAGSRHRLLEVGPVAIQLTREMIARCLHRSKRSGEHAIVVGRRAGAGHWPGSPSNGKAHPVHEARRDPRGFALSASEPAVIADWRRSGLRTPTTDRDPPRMRAPGRSPRRWRTGVRIAPPSANLQRTRLMRIGPPRPRWAWSGSGRRSVAFGGGSRVRLRWPPSSRSRDRRHCGVAGRRLA